MFRTRTTWTSPFQPRCWIRSITLLLLVISLLPVAALAQLGEPCPAGTVTRSDITTYHNDAQRTGWNKLETSLKPCNVDPRSFGLLATLKDINGQIDAQPLIVTNQEIELAQGVRKLYDVVVYVATSTNSVYAIDGTNGVILNERTLGIPVDQSKLPGQCGNNAPSIGISSTPVIDADTKTMYLIAYLLEDDQPVYRIFALDLADLSLKVKPAPLIKASHALADGRAYEFDPTVSRQRSGLLLVNGNVYAAFASFCDFRADATRGWVLGWQTKNSLKPLAQSQLNDLRSNTTGRPYFFLSSIWMSGYGLAADDDGSNLYFITGNSDDKGPFEISKTATLEESVVRMRGDLTDVVDWFTPSDPVYGVHKLDGGDLDFGSGGVLVVPGEFVGIARHLAVAAGKVGQMYLLDRDNMGRYDSSGANHVLDTVDIGKCWCGQSYFIGADGIGRIVSSGDPHLKVWKIIAAPTPKLAVEYSSPIDLAAGSFQKGFFTSISSDLQKSGTGIIWAVRRPTDTKASDLTLHAFDAADGKLLYSAPAGAWPRYRGAAANVVPAVANGRVYVASNGELRIFGLGGQASPAIASALPARGVVGPQSETYSGSIIRVEPTRVWLNTVDQGILEIDTGKAQQERLSVHLEPGESITVRGKRIGKAVQATSIYYGLATQ